MPILTPKEVKICDLLLQALEDKQIAYQLNCKTRTIKNQMAVIKQKFQAKNRVQLALMLMIRKGE